MSNFFFRLTNKFNYLYSNILRIQDYDFKKKLKFIFNKTLDLSKRLYIFFKLRNTNFKISSKFNIYLLLNFKFYSYFKSNFLIKSQIYKYKFAFCFKIIKIFSYYFGNFKVKLKFYGFFLFHFRYFKKIKYLKNIFLKKKRLIIYLIFIIDYLNF
jgi:hypothetical protein